MSEFLLRDPRVPEDYEQMAAVRSAAQPDWPVTAADLARFDATRDPKLFNTQVVAEQAGRIAGVGYIGHDDFSFKEWRYWGGLGVHPDAQGQGIGSALYDELRRRVQARGAREVRTMLSDKPHDKAGRAFLEKRGWVVAWERYEFELHTEHTNLHAFDDLLRRVADDGVQFISLTDLESDPQRNTRLHELDWLLFQDIPMGTAFTKRPLESWVKDELEDPNLRPTLSFVAVRPNVNDPLTGPYIGYSTLGYNRGGNYYYIGMTGVRRENRGKGIAKALKVAAMRALHDVGGGLIRTFNDPPNKAMLGMNQQLGFQRTATMYRYELRLDGEA